MIICNNYTVPIIYKLSWALVFPAVANVYHAHGTHAYMSCTQGASKKYEEKYSYTCSC